MRQLPLDFSRSAALDRRYVTAGFVGHNRNERGEYFRWSATVQVWRVRGMLEDYNQTGPLVWLHSMEFEHDTTTSGQTGPEKPRGARRKRLSRD